MIVNSSLNKSLLLLEKLSHAERFAIHRVTLQLDAVDSFHAPVTMFEQLFTSVNPLLLYFSLVNLLVKLLYYTLLTTD